MARVALEQATPGMVLGEDARDRQGRLLLSAGHELTARTLECLRFWGVLSLDVQGEAIPMETVVSIPAEMLLRAQGEVEARFQNAGWPHPFLEVLRSLAVARRARELAAGRVVGP